MHVKVLEFGFGFGFEIVQYKVVLQLCDEVEVVIDPWQTIAGCASWLMGLVVVVVVLEAWLLEF